MAAAPAALREEMSPPELVHALALRGLRLSGGQTLEIHGAPDSLTEEDRALLARRREALLDHLALHAAARRKPAIPAASRPPRPSHFQEIWYRIASANPDRSDVIPLLLPFAATTGIDAESALRIVIARHDALRYRFLKSGERLEAIINDAADFMVESETLTGEEDETGERETRAQLFLARPMPIDSPWLIRARLLRGAEGSGLLMLVCHHILADGASMAIIDKELRRLIGSAPGTELRLSSPSQFSAFVCWERSWFVGDYAAALVKHWSAFIRDTPPLREPLAGQPLVWTPGNRIVYPFRLGAGPTARLRAQAVALGAGTPLYLLLGLSYLMLRDWSKQGRFAFLITADGRVMASSMQLLSTVGLIMHTDAVAAAMPAEGTLASLVRRLLVEHQSARELSFPSNREHAGIREAEFHHRIGVVVNYLRVATPDAVHATVQGTPLQRAAGEWPDEIPPGQDVGRLAAPLHPIYLRFLMGERSLECSLEFNDALIDRASQQWMVRHFLGELRRICLDPDFSGE